jgi:hypothetical protein
MRSKKKTIDPAATLKPKQFRAPDLERVPIGYRCRSSGTVDL